MRNTSNELHLNWVEYKNGSIGKKDLIEKIYLYILKYPERFKFSRLQKEEIHELFVRLYDRIIKAICSYESKDSCFDAYIHSVVKWGRFELIRRDNQIEFYENIAIKQYYQEEVMEKSRHYPGNYRYVSELQPKFGSQRQNLILVLKLSPFLSDEIIEGLAKGLKMPLNIVIALIEQLETCCKNKIARIKYLERKQNYMAKIYVLKARLECENIDDFNKKKLRADLAKVIQNKDNYIAAREQQVYRVLNIDIARLLNISPSTVCCSLDILKKKMMRKQLASQPLAIEGVENK